MTATNPFVVVVSFACVLAAQNTARPAIACNAKAISLTQRPRYNDLMKRLRAAVRDRKETADGYEFQLESKSIALPEVAEWMSLERLCCPFLKFRLSASGGSDDWALTLTGPSGVKALLDSEFSTSVTSPR